MANIIKKKGNVLVLSDLHFPFNHKKAFDHCRKIRDKYDCRVIIDIGDMFDLHAINYHEKIPDYSFVGKELDDAYLEVSKWKKEFPEVYHVYGNHSSLVSRKANTAGLSKRMIKSLNEIFDLPDTWYWADEWEKDDVRYFHGLGKSGKYAYLDWARDNMQSSVSGHTHLSAGIGWIACSYKLIFGLGVGCLIDHKSYAMEYNKFLPHKPILGCGVVLNNGTLPIFEPMVL